MTSRRRVAVTSQSHRSANIGAWADRAACKGRRGFTELPLAESDEVCAACPVRLECHEAGLTPRQIQAMP